MSTIDHLQSLHRESAPVRYGIELDTELMQQTFPEMSTRDAEWFAAIHNAAPAIFEVLQAAREARLYPPRDWNDFKALHCDVCKEPSGIPDKHFDDCEWKRFADAIDRLEHGEGNG